MPSQCISQWGFWRPSGSRNGGKRPSRRNFDKNTNNLCKSRVDRFAQSNHWKENERADLCSRASVTAPNSFNFAALLQFWLNGELYSECWEDDKSACCRAAHAEILSKPRRTLERRPILNADDYCEYGSSLRNSLRSFPGLAYAARPSLLSRSGDMADCDKIGRQIISQGSTTLDQSKTDIEVDFASFPLRRVAGNGDCQ